MAVLGDKMILKSYNSGKIIINPFDSRNLTNCAYDVRLGNYFYRVKPNQTGPIDPWDETSTVWNDTPERVDQDQFFQIESGEMVLGHTEEFIGTSPDSSITTMIKSRSSIGRNGISICRCAGWGDVGYFNRYTLEIVNHMDRPVKLKVGARVGQVVFIWVSETYKPYKGKYQETSDLTTLIDKWNPEQMLPKLWKDTY